MCQCANGFEDGGRECASVLMDLKMWRFEDEGENVLMC